MVSVVMSVFNGERFLCGAVESILGQSFRDFEFVIIDDGSTDRSRSILDSFQNADVRVKIHHREHRGLIESLNQGCRLAQGKYIARMDADDIASEDRLMSQVDFMEAHPQVGVLGAAVEWINATGKSLVIQRRPTGDADIKAALRDRCCVLWHPTVLFRKEVFAWAGGYRSVAVDAEDYDLWLRAADHFQFANLEQVVLKYRIHPSQVSMRKTAQQTLCMLAVQASAAVRSTGHPDPLDGVPEITSSVLAALGIDEIAQRNAVVADGYAWIRHMIAAGDYSAALAAALQIIESDLSHVESWRVSNLYLSLAELYWREKRIWKCIIAAGQAVLVRPIIIGRPLKPLLHRLGLA
jgi:hypothetical protein